MLAILFSNACCASGSEGAGQAGTSGWPSYDATALQCPEPSEAGCACTGSTSILFIAWLQSLQISPEAHERHASPFCMACHLWPASQGKSGVLSTRPQAAWGREAHPLLQVARVQKLRESMQELGLSDADAAGSDHLQPPQSNGTPAEPVSSSRWVHAPDSQNVSGRAEHIV